MSYMSDRLLSEDSLSAASGRLVLDLRIPWYRSLPLSCVAQVEVAVDGRPLSTADAELAVNGRRYRLDQLGEKTDDVWFVQDAAQLLVPFPQGVAAGAVKHIAVRLDTRIPYIIVGPGTALNNSVTVSRTLTATERRAA